eukprot:g254.t1
MTMVHDEAPLLQPESSVSSGPSIGLDEALELVGHGTFQRRLLLLTGATQLADAMELLLITFLPRQVRCHTAWGASLSDAALATAVFCGMLLGALGAGVLADRRGRRAAFIATTALAAGGGLLAAAATASWQIVALRFVAGMGVGGSPAALALYAEWLPKARRGAALIAFLLLFSIGAIVEAALAWAVLPTAWGWRGLLVLSALPSVLLLGCALRGPTKWLPESPRYMLLSGQEDEARAMLVRAYRANRRRHESGGACAEVPARLYAKLEVEVGGGAGAGARAVTKAGATADGVVDAGTGTGKDEDANALDPSPSSIFGTCGECACAAARRLGVRALFAPSLLAPTVLLCALFLLMAVVYYGVVLLTPTLVRLAGTTDDAAAAACQPFSNADYLANVVANAGELPGLAAAAVLLEHPRVGRRRTVTLFFSSAGLLLLLLAVAQRGAGGDDADPALLPLPRAAAVALLFLARSACLGFNQSLWVVATESFPTAVRATGVGFSTMFARVGGIIAGSAVAPLFAHSRRAALLVCAAGCAVSAALAWRLPNRRVAGGKGGAKGGTTGAGSAGVTDGVDGGSSSHPAAEGAGALVDAVADY